MPASDGLRNSPTRRDERSNRAPRRLAERVPPHNMEAETGLLSSCIVDGGRDTLTACIDNKLRPESFFKVAHQLTYKSMLDLYEEGIPIDEIVLAERLKRNGDLEAVGGVPFISELASAVDTALGASYWLDIVKDKDLTRRLIRTATETVEQCYQQTDSIDQFLEQVEQSIFQISQDRVVETARHIGGPIDEASRQIHLLLQRKVSQYGVRTGFRDIDAMTFGMHPGEMIVLAARPSVGKTSLAMNFAEAAVCPNPGEKVEPQPTLVFSLEMSSEQLAMRLLTCRARMDAKRLREGFANKEEQGALAKAAKELKGAPLYIDDSGGLSVLEIRAKARRLASRLAGTTPLRLVIVDYLQLAHGTSSAVNRENQIAEISRGLKAMAKELGVPVLVLSQLNRDSEKERRDPRLSDLRESGSIEQDADVVFLLHRPQHRDDADGDGVGRPNPGDVERINLIIAKQRNGPVGEVPLTFRRHYTRFENFTH